MTGSGGSGKTTKIKELVSQFPANQVVWINPARLRAEIIKATKIETKVVVIERVTETTKMLKILRYIVNRISIFENEEEFSTIYPHFIVSTSNLLRNELTLFEEYFEIIENHYDYHFNSNILNKEVVKNSFSISNKSVPNDTLENTLNRLFVGFNQSQMSENTDAAERTQIADDFLQIQQIVREALTQSPQQDQ